jgi:Lecithin:cholesterol acyltransferase
MDCIFLIPGIEGSRLSLGTEEVWPPTPNEMIGGYNRIAKLLDPNTIATGIWDETVIFGLIHYPVYKPIMDKLDEIAQELGARRVNFFYDWRTDLWNSTPPFTASSEKLAKAIETSVAGGASSITLVCHSMGCLVARLVLESPRYKNTSWFAKISRIVCICGPNLGAPVAIGRALACEGPSLGLSAAQLQAIENDARYPAGFQCFPEPGIDVLYDVSSGHAVPVNVYGAAEDAKYELTHSNAQAAAASWSELNIDGHPTSVSYTVIGGTGYTTSKAYLFNGTRFVQTITEDGDGTVPLWSALAGKYASHYTVTGDHVGILGTPQLKQTLDQIFGLPIMSAFVQAAGVTVTVNKHTFRPDEMMQVVVIPDTPTAEIEGRLTLAFVGSPRTRASPSLAAYGTGSTLTYKGPETTHFSTRLAAPHIPGAYILKFEGTHSSIEASSAVFFVNAASPVSIHSVRNVQKETEHKPAKIAPGRRAKAKRRK